MGAPADSGAKGCAGCLLWGGWLGLNVLAMVWIVQDVGVVPALIAFGVLSVLAIAFRADRRPGAPK